MRYIYLAFIFLPFSSWMSSLIWDLYWCSRVSVLRTWWQTREIRKTNYRSACHAFSNIVELFFEDKTYDNWRHFKDYNLITQAFISIVEPTTESIKINRITCENVTLYLFSFHYSRMFSYSTTTTCLYIYIYFRSCSRKVLLQ